MHHIRQAIRRALSGGRRLTTTQVHERVTADYRLRRTLFGDVAGELARMLATGDVACRPVGSDAVWKL